MDLDVAHRALEDAEQGIGRGRVVALVVIGTALLANYWLVPIVLVVLAVGALAVLGWGL